MYNGNLCEVIGKRRGWYVQFYWLPTITMAAQIIEKVAIFEHNQHHFRTPPAATNRYIEKWGENNNL